MENNNDRSSAGRSSHINRRNALKLAGASIGGLTTPEIALSGRTRGSGGTVAIPLVENGDEVLLEKQVSKKWWAEIERVKRVYENVASKWKNKRGVKDVNRVASDKQIHGRNITQLNVEVVPEEYTGGIPEEANGVDVQFTEWQPPTRTHSCQSELAGNFDSMPGGVICGEHLVGTSACRIWDGSKYTMMTAYHLFDNGGKCEDNVVGDTLRQSGRDVGPVDTQKKGDDLVLVRDESSTISFSKDVYYRNGRITMQGAATNYDYMMSNFTTVEATGRNTGFTAGYIDAYPVEGGDCFHYHQNGVRSTCEVVSGDSGGPCYWIYEGSDGQKKAALVHGTSLATNPKDSYTDCHDNQIYYYRTGGSSEQLTNQYGWKIGVK